LAFYLNRFAATYFENGAMPISTVTVLGLSSDPENPENKRVQAFFRRAAAGLRNAFRILALGREVKWENAQSPIKDLATPELKEQARKDIAQAFGIPQAYLDDMAYSTAAREYKRGLYDEKIIPDAERIASALNAQWLNQLGYELTFAPEEMSLYQEDETNRAASVSQLAAVIDQSPRAARFVMQVLGYTLSSEQQQELDVMVATRAADPARGFAPTGESPSANLTKAAERAQFRKFAEKRRAEGHPEKISDFVFKSLNLAEQMQIKAAVGAQSSDTDKPFRY
jgi:hypothetical protein